MKLACVVHRYGPEATGGSEAHCRAVAARLAERHDVTVLTSCAIDYVSWRNELPPGESRDGRVRVRRFPVERPRDVHRFWEISETVFNGGATEADQTRWFIENGPRLPGLIDHLASHGADYDRVLFWSYRYYPAFFGLPLVADRALLVPTAEDDEAIRTIAMLRPFFAKPRGYLFLTPEEQALVASHCDGPLPASAVIGIGLEPAAPTVAAPPADVRDPFLVYVGRVERNKGCERLLEDYQAYLDYQMDLDAAATSRGAGAPAAATAGAPATPLSLVLAGPVRMPIPGIPTLHVLGFVPDETRDALLQRARAFVMPSPYESLNIALLEAWNHGTAALINGRCLPLKGQVRRANGGLYYERTLDFIHAARYLATHAAEAAHFGRQGLAYVDREYRWPVVMARIEGVLRDA